MSRAPKKPIDDPKVRAIMLAAGTAWLGAMAFTLSNPRKRRRFIDDIGRTIAENAAREAKSKEQLRIRIEVEKAERKAKEAREKRRYLAKYFPPRTRRVLAPYSDALEVTETGGWGGRVGFANRSEIADASIDAAWSPWDGRGKFYARFEKVLFEGEFEDRGGYVLFPVANLVGTSKDYFTEEQTEIILRLMGGDGGPKELTFHRIKR